MAPSLTSAGAAAFVLLGFTLYQSFLSRILSQPGTGQTNLKEGANLCWRVLLRHWHCLRMAIAPLTSDQRECV